MEYRPIDTGYPAAWSDSRLRTAAWKDGRFFVDFSVSQTGTTLRALFRVPLMTKIMTERMPLMDVEHLEVHKGASRKYLFYEILNSEMWRDHALAFKEEGMVKHYRFWCRNGCVDVLSLEPPAFRSIPAIAGGKAQ